MKNKHKQGYIKSLKGIEKFLKKSTAKYNHSAVVPKQISESSFYCYTYEYASEIADYIEKKHNIKRFKVDGVSDEWKKESKYIVFS